MPRETQMDQMLAPVEMAVELIGRQQDGIFNRIVTPKRAPNSINGVPEKDIVDSVLQQLQEETYGSQITQ
jgi:hypothetical protein|tara:strand:- start:10573 stop:10782 length:210 start_codon:yes stop_codon:yes gene_type:complete